MLIELQIGVNFAYAHLCSKVEAASILRKRTGSPIIRAALFNYKKGLMKTYSSSNCYLLLKKIISSSLLRSYLTTCLIESHNCSNNDSF